MHLKKNKCIKVFGIYECGVRWRSEFYLDPHTIKFDIVLGLTELKGDSWALAEVCTLLSAILVFNEISKIHFHQIQIHMNPI